MNKFSDYLRIREAAQLLGVSINTLRNWDDKKQLISYRHPINGYRLYLKEDLKKLLNKLSKNAQ